METIAIHSRNIAQQIIDAGQAVINIEPNRNQSGKLVFVFERTNTVIDVLERNRRKQKVSHEIYERSE